VALRNRPYGQALPFSGRKKEKVLPRKERAFAFTIASLLAFLASFLLRQLSHHNQFLRRAITYLSFARDSQAFRSEALPPPKDFFLS